MSKRITIQKSDPKRGRLAVLVGASLLLVGVVAVWALQFHISMENNLFADFSQEFEQTSSQVQQGIELVEEAAQIPETPEQAFEETYINSQIFQQLAEERLMEEQQLSLPISE